MFRKWGKLMIIVLLVLLIGVTPVYARAGGGSSGGGSSGGSSGRSSRNHSSPTYSRRGSAIRRMESVIGTGVLFATMVGINVYQKRHKAIKMHREAKGQLKQLDDSDFFWDEKRIKKKVENCYYIVQEAWSNQDIDELKKYLSSDLLEAWQTKLNWYEFQGKKNVLKNIKLLKHDVVSLYDDENNDKDFFWVYIEGKMDDRMIDNENQILEQNNGVFVEYWKFIRMGDEIYLDKVLQAGEFEN